ncbi:class I SAM-dependent DNA methyltransferase [Streptomyces sp. MB09-02B]|uniref:class I SAM-dependent DNA methyltransferase n=1 Tax=Streptomyces sp. MB09-02B TaxID=3028667 RepID=UPI0029B84D81|nr:methyltransferase domain-containing protein [Streptomyces sp. MB09-02B]MDX3642326.1 methyltransferase domain-containing protein [Streptomyces sp. MB09-02B]
MTTPRHTTTRESYDTVATDYEKLLRDELARSPFERAVLGVFAELVSQAGGGRVADLGCGPGRITGHLASLGLDICGVDLSPQMVAVARWVHPGLRFDVGTMTALDFEDGCLAGALAWYSTVHTPPAELPQLFREFHRILAPGGLLAMAYKVGDESVHLTHAYGHPLDLDVYRFDPDRIAALLGSAGLTESARLVREADGPGTVASTPQAYVLARKPG